MIAMMPWQTILCSASINSPVFVWLVVQSLFFLSIGSRSWPGNGLHTEGEKSVQRAVYKDFKKF